MPASCAAASLLALVLLASGPLLGERHPRLLCRFGRRRRAPLLRHEGRGIGRMPASGLHSGHAGHDSRRCVSRDPAFPASVAGTRPIGRQRGSSAAVPLSEGPGSLDPSSSSLSLLGSERAGARPHLAAA